MEFAFTVYYDIIDLMNDLHEATSRELICGSKPVMRSNGFVLQRTLLLILAVLHHHL